MTLFRRHFDEKTVEKKIKKQLSTFFINQIINQYIYARLHSHTNSKRRQNCMFFAAQVNSKSPRQAGLKYIFHHSHLFGAFY